MKIDISQKILEKWKSSGIDMSVIKSDPYEVDMKGLLLLNGNLFRFKFVIETPDGKKIDMSDNPLWTSLVKQSMEIDCTVGKMTYHAGLPKSRADGFGQYLYADCYIEWRMQIDEDKLTEDQWDKMTKPDFIKDNCDKTGPVLKGKKGKKKKESVPEEIDIPVDTEINLEEV